MDIFCPKCGEPWDIAELVEANISIRRFRRDGCSVFNTRCNTVRNEEIAEKSAIIFDLLGEDLDGIASMSQDI